MKALVQSKQISNFLFAANTRSLFKRFQSFSIPLLSKNENFCWKNLSSHKFTLSTSNFRSFSNAANTKGSSESKYVLPAAEKARSLVASRKSGTLTTVSLEENKSDNVPPLFGSVMPYVILPETKGNPVFAVRVDEMHYHHITNYPRGSFLVFPVTPVGIPPSEVPVPRLNFTGNITALDDSLARIAREHFLKRHPSAKPFFEKSEFKFYQFQPTEIYFLGAKEFGKTEIISIEEYNDAIVDPLSVHTLNLLQYIHSNFQEDLHLLYKEYGDGTPIDPKSVFVFSIDRLGFNLLAQLENDNRWLELRLPFPYEIYGYETCLSGIASSLQIVKNKHPQ